MNGRESLSSNSIIAVKVQVSPQPFSVLATETALTDRQNIHEQDYLVLSNSIR